MNCRGAAANARHREEGWAMVYPKEKTTRLPRLHVMPSKVPISSHLIPMMPSEEVSIINLIPTIQTGKLISVK